MSESIREWMTARRSQQSASQPASHRHDTPVRLLITGLLATLLLVLQGCGGAEGPEGAENLAAGELVYRRNCYSCHASGAAGAPRLGDSRAWAARSAQGWDTLMRHTIEGVRSMPARGLCRQCSDDDLALSLGYMLQRSGGLPDDVPARLLARLEPDPVVPVTPGAPGTPGTGGAD